MKRSPFIVARFGLKGALLVLVLTCTIPAYGQFDRGNPSVTTATSATGGSFYDYSGGSGVVMDVNVWGFVRQPGKYRVPTSTKLIQIISYAGGPIDRAKMDEVKILHDLTIDSTIANAVELYDLEAYQQSGNVDLNPVLYPNDTVIIPGDNINAFTEIVGVIRDIMLVVGTIVGIYYAGK